MHPGSRYQMYQTENGLNNNRLDPVWISYIYWCDNYLL